jgi:hypothetical protein
MCLYSIIHTYISHQNNKTSNILQPTFNLLSEVVYIFYIPKNFGRRKILRFVIFTSFTHNGFMNYKEYVYILYMRKN